RCEPERRVRSIVWQGCTRSRGATEGWLPARESPLPDLLHRTRDAGLLCRPFGRYSGRAKEADSRNARARRPERLGRRSHQEVFERHAAAAWAWRRPSFTARSSWFWTNLRMASTRLAGATSVRFSTT